MACEYVKEHYGVPADIGRRIVFKGRPGIIAKDRGNYIGVNFDSDKPGVICNVHPTDGVEYGEMGRIRNISAPQQRYQDYLEISECFENFKSYLVYLSRRVSKGG